MIQFCRRVAAKVSIQLLGNRNIHSQGVCSCYPTQHCDEVCVRFLRITYNWFTKILDSSRHEGEHQKNQYWSLLLLDKPHHMSRSCYRKCSVKFYLIKDFFQCVVNDVTFTIHKLKVNGDNRTGNRFKDPQQSQNKAIHCLSDTKLKSLLFYAIYGYL